MHRRAAWAIATVALGIAATTVGTPAFAAAAPTISTPASVTGTSLITVSGTAPAGATVHLYESAYNWNDFYPAPDYHTQEPVTTTASSAGKYSFQRYVDTGFLFYVEADGQRSSTARVHMQVMPYFSLSSPSNGTVTVHVAPDPGQPSLQVRVERKSGTSWTTVSTGYTDDGGTYDATLSGQPTGSQSYRAYVGGDTETDIAENTSAAQNVTVKGGSSSTTPGPRAGEVQFTKIQYHGPSGLNNEWVRLTNKSSRTLNLQGTTVKDAAGNTYTFSGSYPLGVGRNVYVHTGAGTNGKPDSQHRYWGRTGYIWNNGGDTATLRSGSTTLDSCKWTSDKGVTYC